jgi:hypothetical protein
LKEITLPCSGFLKDIDECLIKAQRIVGNCRDKGSIRVL